MSPNGDQPSPPTPIDTVRYSVIPSEEGESAADGGAVQPVGPHPPEIARHHLDARVVAIGTPREPGSIDQRTPATVKEDGAHHEQQDGEDTQRERQKPENEGDERHRGPAVGAPFVLMC